jgi:hypothetical protein
MRLTMVIVLNAFIKKGDSLKLTSCSWVTTNKKPTNKGKIFYFIDAWFLPTFAPKVWIPKVI